MFRKPHDTALSTKSNLRKKEVKELRQSIRFHFANYTDEDDNLLFGNGKEIELLKLKSGIQMLKPKDGAPLFFQTPDKRYYPTVFALWQAPTIIPVIYTSSFVSGKILTGAGLMVPGIIVPKEGLPSLLNKTVVAIATYSNPKPFAVGYCCSENFEAAVASGKGKVVEVLHSYLDVLYTQYATELPPEGFTENAVYPLISDVLDPEETEDETPESKDASEEIISETPDETPNENPISDEVPEETQETILVETPVETPISEKDLDDQFLHLCIRCLNEVEVDDLPMQVSTFNSKFLIQHDFVNSKKSSEYYCGDVWRENSLNWSGTSFKKISKLTAFLTEKKVIQVKDVNKQPTIVSVNHSHPWLVKYAEYLKHFKAEAVKRRSGNSGNSGNENVELANTKVAEVFKINQIMKNVFISMQLDPEALYSMADAKSVLTGYCQSKNLIPEEDHSIIMLDDGLKDALFRDKKAPEGGFPNILTRKEAFDLFCSRLIPYHAIQVNNRMVVKKGACNSITITTEKVKGAKSLQTCVRNYLEFSLDTKELLKALTKACAASGSVQSNYTGQYIQIQGKVASAVKDCLIKEFKIPSKYINIKK